MCDIYGQSLFVKILVKFLHTHHGSFNFKSYNVELCMKGGI